MKSMSLQRSICEELTRASDLACLGGHNQPLSESLTNLSYPSSSPQYTFSNFSKLTSGLQIYVPPRRCIDLKRFAVSSDTPAPVESWQYLDALRDIPSVPALGISDLLEFDPEAEDWIHWSPNLSGGFRPA